MTKRFLALLLALVMCLSLAACGGDKDSEEEKDEEKVEQAEDKKDDGKKDDGGSESNNGGKEENSVLDRIKRKYVYNGYYEYRYDVNGKLIEECFCDYQGLRTYKITYSPDGPITGKVDYSGASITKKYEYNEVGLLITEFELDSNGQTKQITSYTYNDQGDIHTATFDYGYEINKYEYKYEYDSSGNMTKKEYYAANEQNVLIQEGDQIWRHEYEYDANGNMTLDRYVKSGNVISNHHFYEYDENNNLIKVTNTGGNTEIVYSTETYEYDANGYVTVYKKVDPENNETKDYYSCKYIAAGNVTQAIIYMDEMYSELECVYDNNNMATKSIAHIGGYKPKDDTIYRTVTREYSFDENLNVVSYKNFIDYADPDKEDYELVTDISQYYTETN